MIRNLVRHSWCLPIAIVAFGFFPANKQLAYTTDGVIYAALATSVRVYKEFALNNEFFGLRPIFPYLAAYLDVFLGNQLLSVWVLSRLFYAISVGLLILLGRVYFKQYAGVAAAILSVFSVSLLLFADVPHLDHLVSATLLLLFLLSFVVLSRQRTLEFVLLGCVFGLTYLVKPSLYPFIAIPIPAFVLISKFRNRKTFFGLLVAYGIFVAIAAAWITYANAQDNLYADPTSVGVFSIVIQKLNFVDLCTPNCVNTTSTLFSTIGDIYQSYIAEFFFLSFVFILGWLRVVYLAWFTKTEKRESYQYLSLVLGVYLVIVLFVYLVRLRPRQLLAFYYLNYLVAADFLTWLGLWLYHRVKPQQNKDDNMWLRLLIGAAPFAVYAGLLLFSTTPERGSAIEYYSKNNLVTLFNEHRSTSWSVPRVEEFLPIANWLTDNVPTQTNIMFDHLPSWSTSVLTNGSVSVYSTPIQSEREFLNLNESDTQNTTLISVYRDLKVNFGYLTEDHFLDYIDKNHIQYVVVAGYNRFLSLYVANSPAFVKVAHLAGDYEVYEVLSTTTSVTVIPAMAESGLVAFLHQISANDAERYDQLVSVLGHRWHNHVDGVSQLDIPTTLRSGYVMPAMVQSWYAYFDEDFIIDRIENDNGVLSDNELATLYLAANDFDQAVAQVDVGSTDLEGLAGYLFALNQAQRQQLAVDLDLENEQNTACNALIKLNTDLSKQVQLYFLYCRAFEAQLDHQQVISSFYEDKIARNNALKAFAPNDDLSYALYLTRIMQYDGALSVIDRGLERYADNPSLLLQKAEIYIAEGKESDAFDLWTAISALPDVPQTSLETIYVRKGRLLQNVKQDIEGAEQVLLEGLRQIEDPIWLPAQYANLLAKSDRGDQGLAFLADRLITNPADGRAHLNYLLFAKQNGFKSEFAAVCEDITDRIGRHDANFQRLISLCN